MAFNTLSYAFFLPAVISFFYAAPHSLRWAVLLAASCYYYASYIPKYIFVMLALITVDYLAGRWMEKARGKTRKAILVGSILSNVGMLATFKYGPWILPLGLSYHTFQSMSYTIEVYRGRWKAERHFGVFALYVMFFPQLSVGPIERPQNLLAQFHARQHFDQARFLEGLKLAAQGFFKKLIVADSLAVVVNQVYGNPFDYTGLSLAFATICFGIQVFYDFSGYTDIARGSARMLGFSLTENFNKPFLSQSIAEFWHRWHISLTSWFRDYVYIPLGGNRGSRWKTIRNIVIVFVLSGIWHGATFVFIVFGFLNAAFYLLSDAVGKAKIKGHPQLSRAINITFTLAMIFYTFIFFRAQSAAGALHIARSIFWGTQGFHWSGGLVPAESASISAATLLVLIPIEVIRQSLARSWFLSLNVWLRRAIKHFCWSLLLVIIYLKISSPQQGPQQFIYFQF